MNRTYEFGFQCRRHTQNSILYIKVNNIQDDEDIFFCELCPLTYQNFCMEDCTAIKQILNWNQESYIMNFLPFNNDANFVKKIQRILSQKASQQTFEQIDQLYDQLQSKLIEMVAGTKKKAHELAKQLRNLNQISADIYSDIIKINDIKNIVLNENISQNDKEKRTRNLLKQIYQDKQNNTNTFSDIIQQQQNLLKEFQQTQQSLFSNQLQNLINQNIFAKEYHELFPLNNINLIPSLEFERIPQQINNQPIFDISNPLVVKRKNNQIKFIVQNQFQQQQFYLKQILNKKSEYFLKFKIKSASSYNQQNNFLQQIQHINPNYLENTNFQIELFSKTNQNNSFSLNCNFTDLLQNSQNKVNQEQNLKLNNYKNLDFNPEISAQNTSKQKLQKNMSTQSDQQSQHIYDIENSLQNKRFFSNQIIYHQDSISQNQINSLKAQKIQTVDDDDLILDNFENIAQNQQNNNLLSYMNAPQIDSKRFSTFSKFQQKKQANEIQFSNDLLIDNPQEQLFKNNNNQQSYFEDITQNQQNNNLLSYMNAPQIDSKRFSTFSKFQQKNQANEIQFSNDQLIDNPQEQLFKNNNNQQQKNIEIIVQIQILQGIFQATYFTNQQNISSLPQKLQKQLADSENLYLKIIFNGQQQLILLQASELVGSYDI
ncbi:hypothetical protein ABPG72_022397 [Tetrahymena utriculariae]